MFLILRFLITFAVVIFIGHEIPGFEIKDETDAFFFAIILSAVNSIIRPVLVFLTLPITILTLGLFTLVINVFTFYLATVISYGVHFHSFSALFWGGFVVWVVSTVTNYFIWKTNMY
ncbi:MAG: phage holin family protein [Gammaproteobacteria bacterium]|nr:hypothetical protein [Chlamydiia bacterium]MCH9690381.1 phage holin family protein [Gammaproteobacteria bacterium]